MSDYLMNTCFIDLGNHLLRDAENFRAKFSVVFKILQVKNPQGILVVSKYLPSK